MSKLKKILIHPGYPKTGTTFLQLHVFSNSKNYFYVGKNAIVTENQKLFQNIFREYFCNNNIYSLDTEVYIYNYLNRISKRQNKTSLLFSLENLFDVESRATKKKTYVTIEKVLLKLFNFFERFSVQTNFLIFFRDPRVVLHRYYLDRYSSYTKENIFNYNQFIKFQIKKKNSFADSIKYEKLIKKINKKILKKTYFFKYEDIFLLRDIRKIKILEKILFLRKNFIKEQLIKIGYVNRVFIKDRKFYIRDKTYPLFMYKIKKKLKIENFKFIFLFLKYLFIFTKIRHQINYEDTSKFFNKTNKFLNQLKTIKII